MELERKTIFLYPELYEQDRSRFKQTSRLVTNISAITNVANKSIQKILYGGCFSTVNCIPIVSMLCIGQATEKFDKYSNVRICIAKYNDIDYTDNYDKILEEVKNNKSDISHLVALHISSSKKTIKFHSDTNNQFDAIVETDLDQLENLLIAIMLDISLYHFFKLSDNIEERKDFNTLKFKYIVNHLSNDDFKKTYGASIDKEKPIYLPFSMKRIINLSNGSNEEQRNKEINELIKDYCNFLVSSKSICIKLNNKGYIDNPYDLKNLYKTVEAMIKKSISEKKIDISKKTIILMPNENMTQNLTPIMIKYQQEQIEISKWLNFLNSGINKYKIFVINGVE